jgi:hypothetical protein
VSIKPLLLSFVIAFFCIACEPKGAHNLTGELTRGLAKYILGTRVMRSKSCEGNFNLDLYSSDDNQAEWLSDQGEKLQAAGYISISAPDQQGKVHITVLEKLKPFIIVDTGNFIRVSTGNIVIDEITGITDAPMGGTNTKQVKYTGHVEPNELVKIFKISWRCDFNKTEKYTETFIKDADGWRVKE